MQSAKTRPGADYASDLKLLIAKFRLKLQKVGKTTRLLRYNLDQIPYYTVEVTNRFKGLDSVNKVPRKPRMHEMSPWYFNLLEEITSPFHSAVFLYLFALFI